jgi:hypothetical protein
MQLFLQTLEKPMDRVEALEQVLELAVENIIDDAAARENGLEKTQADQKEACTIVRTLIADMSWKF